MTTWAVVCEISYLDPQYRRKGETSIQFATRVKEMIAEEAGLISVPWDGLLKYRTPRPEIKHRRMQIYAKIVRQRFRQLKGKNISSLDERSPSESLERSQYIAEEETGATETGK